MTDTGVRCDRHVGEVFPPRCFDCQAEAAEPSRLPAPAQPDASAVAPGSRDGSWPVAAVGLGSSVTDAAQ